MNNENAHIVSDSTLPESSPPPDLAAVPHGNSPETSEVVGATLPGPEPQRWFLVFFQSGGSSDPLGYMSGYAFHRVRTLMDCHPIATGSTVDVWLDSPGGSATIAYKLMLELRHYFSKVRIVIPSFAKSAATLFAIGADEIVMGHSAELGPLDVQVGHPDREGVTISGLDASRALGFLADFALDYLVIGGSSVFASTELPRLDVLREFSSFTAKFLEPMVSKLDPQLVHRAAQDLELATHYAVEVMRRRTDWNGSDQRLIDLAEHLVTHYPAHEYLISREEAAALDLPVTCLEEYDKNGAVGVLYQAYARNAFADGSRNHLFHFWSEDELDDKLSELLSPQNAGECDNGNTDEEDDEAN
jgi:hypothetical protein